jgi:hypothetical protein
MKNMLNAEASLPLLKQGAPTDSNQPGTSLGFSQTCLSLPATKVGCPIAPISCGGLWR